MNDDPAGRPYTQSREKRAEGSKTEKDFFIEAQKFKLRKGSGLNRVFLGPVEKAWRLYEPVMRMIAII